MIGMMKCGFFVRNGDIEGIRQSTGNWQRDNNIKWTKNALMEPLGATQLNRAKEVV